VQEQSNIESQNIKEETIDIEYHQDFLTLSKPKIEFHHASMQYFAIAMTALLVTT
jgi:hypothetical protein